jgi:TRAP-type mannitol/chloroaromatic compound transport system substrate-binding protein
MKKSLRAALCGIVAAGFVGGMAVVAQAQDKITWRMQTIAAPNTSEYDDLAQAFADRVGELSEGQLEIKLFSSGVLSNELEAGTAVGRGVFEVWHSYLQLFASKEPVFRSANEWPVNADRLQAAMWYEQGGAELYREALAKHNMYHLGVTPVSGEHIWSKVPLNSVADLQGLKIRSGGVASRSFAELGAAPVSMGGGDVYQGLQRGVVDAAEWTTLTVNYGFGLHEVTNYVVTPSYSGGATYDWVVNLDAWNALPDHLKNIVNAALQEVGFSYWMKVKSEETVTFQKLRDAGIEIIEWSDADMRTLEEARMKVVAEDLTEGAPEYKAVLQHQFRFLETLGYDVPDQYME